MKEQQERDLSAEVKAFMASVQGCNANELVEILGGMIADVRANSYFVGLPVEEGDDIAKSKQDEDAPNSDIMATVNKIDGILKQSHQPRKALAVLEICAQLVRTRY